MNIHTQKHSAPLVTAFPITTETTGFTHVTEQITSAERAHLARLSAIAQRNPQYFHNGNIFEMLLLE